MRNGAASSVESIQWTVSSVIFSRPVLCYYYYYYYYYYYCVVHFT